MNRKLLANGLSFILAISLNCTVFATESVTESTAEPVTEIATESTTEPVTEIATESVATTQQSGDPMVRVTQEWLNSTYTGVTGYTPITVDGQTGWGTVYALLHALQMELGISSTSDNFGTTTTAKFNERYPNGVRQQSSDDTSKSNIYSIIQGALWCKGYSVGVNNLTGNFYDGTGGAIIEMKKDMGFINPDSTVTLDVMKALLSMSQFKLISGGDANIRTIQQSLNRRYGNQIGILPCDGFYQRDTNVGLIKALQIELGQNADGICGNVTLSACPLLYRGGPVANQQVVYILQYALYANGFNPNGFDGGFGGGVENAVKGFQSLMALTPDGYVGKQTWGALLVSCGDTTRSSVACDTRFEMTDERIQYLKSNGYKIVGRYLTGGDFKELRPDEPRRILDAGLEFFPIFQESGTDLSYFTPPRGAQDALAASKAAKSFGIPKDSTIYFAVDTDPTAAEIQAYIIPYFAALKTTMQYGQGSYYKIGVYGTRNVCSQVMKLGYAETCFVSDMSTGFSGNLGFKMPNNWTFDQFKEIQVTTASGTWDLDKVAYSNNLPAVVHTTIPSGSTNYFLGEFTFTGENNGRLFGVADNQMRARVNWNLLESVPAGNLLLEVDILQYLYADSDDRPVYLPVGHKQMDYNESSGVFEFDWINVNPDTDYRFQYTCYKFVGGVDSEGNPLREPVRCAMSVYIDTRD